MTEYVVSSGETWLCPPWAIAPSARVTVRECPLRCGVRIVWLKAVEGGLSACNQDGTSHASTCTQGPNRRTPRASREEAAL
jgi:hypothetical protein